MTDQLSVSKGLGGRISLHSRGSTVGPDEELCQRKEEEENEAEQSLQID